MKRPLTTIAAALIAAVLITLLIQAAANSSERNSAVSPTKTERSNEHTAQPSVSKITPEDAPPRRLPGKVIGGRTTLVNLLVGGMDLSDRNILELSQFIEEFRAKIHSVLYSNARIISDENGLIRVDITVPANTVMELRKQCYAGVAQAIGEEKLTELAEKHRLEMLDGEFENYGEFSIAITATAKQMDGIALVHLRKETKRVFGGDPTTFWGEGDYLRDDLIKQYGQIGDEISRRLGAP